MSTYTPDSPHSGTSELDEKEPEAVRRAIHRRSEELKQQELERALDQFRSHGDLTQRQQEIIEQMASAIVVGVLAAPDSMLERASEYDENTVRTAIELFDSDR